MIRLRLPALRERREDVPPLTRFFLQKSAQELGVEAKRITDAALAQLMQFDFPGNVRQLENICHWLTVMAPAPGDRCRRTCRRNCSGRDRCGARADEATLGAGVVAAAPHRRRRRPRRSVAAAPSATPVSRAGGSRSPRRCRRRGSAAWSAMPRILLEAGEPMVWDTLTRKFEAQLIHTALEITRGRRIEAAQKLGIGRNTITRKIQELGLDD